LKGCTPPPLPPLPVTDSLTSLKAHKLWNLWEYPCPYLSFCVSVCPRMSVCPTTANRTVGTALFPPLLVWYQLYFPLVGVAPVHFRLGANLLAKRMQWLRCGCIFCRISLELAQQMASDTGAVVPIPAKWLAVACEKIPRW